MKRYYGVFAAMSLGAELIAGAARGQEPPEDRTAAPAVSRAEQIRRTVETNQARKEAKARWYAAERERQARAWEAYLAALPELQKAQAAQYQAEAAMRQAYAQEQRNYIEAERARAAAQAQQAQVMVGMGQVSNGQQQNAILSEGVQALQRLRIPDPFRIQVTGPHR